MDERLVLEEMSRCIQQHHDDYIALNRRVFLEYPPTDYGSYAYTYYDGNGTALYHGYTANAVQRAEAHYEKAPWASWVEDVRYRRCSNTHQARKLESRLHAKVDAVYKFCYHGMGKELRQEWTDFDNEYKINHVTGSCKLPGGLCDLAHWIARFQ